ncbi:Glycoside Hydrolase Family 13/Glycoside Hydrolase Family 133 protein [Tuber magnatum]|uniref:Glycogen debranching enzyme n=1 Tax=Tuber magnatum TaxID=42249 RepID=A0A317SCR6_9PEZI|nr:Glycoside Hydrolase Family 13/Glycoside Hydrolase Family 133 protein [Tuber magnatum]
MSPPLVYMLPLTDTGAPDIAGDHIGLPPPREPYTLRIAIEGASSITRNGSLWTNVPAKGDNFGRNKFREFKLTPSFSRTLHIDVPIALPGTFCYYITYDPLPSLKELSSPTNPSGGAKTGTHWFTVAARLSVNGEPLALDSLSCFSVVSKWLGPVEKWDGYMRYIAEKGYNMVHFTPMMHRGESNSPYSIYDQLAFDPEAFPNGTDDVALIVDRMEKRHGLLSLTDVVWNHTAHNSLWLQSHPESGYNLVTAPWLEAAFELDTALLDFGNHLEALGFPTELETQEDLLKIMDGVKTHVIGALRLWEFYVVNVEAATDAVIEAYISGKSDSKLIDTAEYKSGLSLHDMTQFLIKNGLKGADILGSRYSRTIDPGVGAAFLALECGKPDPKNAKGVEEAKQALIRVYNRITYLRLDSNGPKMGKITKESPIIETYFTRLPKNEITAQHDPKSLALANNGWIWSNVADFAGPKSRSYLRREVIVWGDCVKLRFGDKPEDNPFLWQFMVEYTKLMARCFHGFRIDNCHSTPIHVGQYLLDIAREVREDLYVVAELFTGSEHQDRRFVEHLGLGSLVREAMVAWGPGELSRLVHRHGGKPIGSLRQELVVRAVTASPIHALFMDCTHDNETPTQKRTPQDTLPNGALVAMCDCGIGSVMGYDEIYPKLLNLVTEPRIYYPPPEKIDETTPGIGKVKGLLNRIHTEMGKDGFTEMHVHHEGEYITVHRVHPKSHKGYFLIAHTAFGPGDHRGDFNPITVTGTKVKVIGSWTLVADGSDERKEKVLSQPDYLTGLPAKLVEVESPKIGENGNTTTITVPEKFPPGSIALLETWIPGTDGESLAQFVTSGAEEAFANTSLVDLNFVLYRCESEERDSSDDRDGCYNIPGYGALVYAGLQGWWSVLKDVIRNNDLAHPICQHLRDGQWALDYIVGRLEKLEARGNKGLAEPTEWLKERFDRIRSVPGFLLPRYFALVMQTAYTTAVERATSFFTEDIREGTAFLKELSLVSLQMTGLMDSTSLWPGKKVACMAAGLPHFSYDYMRCWGRDVFISIRGLYLATGRYEDAKEHILAFGSVLKHGMIPNLLDGGRKPRYNARDSIWFYLQAVQDYTGIVPNGIELLREKVKRRFLPFDDTWFNYDDPRAYSRESTIAEIIHEALERHALGFEFLEANAGPGLDNQMKWEGFTVGVKPDWTTGIIKGGSQFNCGTWMDKMGESERAGNKGVPGTPRDGAAIEITGLLYSTLKWVAELRKKKLYKWDSVKTSQGKGITFDMWADLLKKNFEKLYYVPEDPGEDSKYSIKPELIGRRGIYKDVWGGGKEYEDYQFRPNFAIAMTVAPDLFVPKHAIRCLEIADEVLRGPTGMATLDPIDKDYRPYYRNSEDSDDFATSKGRNYHQGPEWLWPTGFYLRALLTFSPPNIETLQQINLRMDGCRKAINESPWAGLTELTNKNGEICYDSCPTQAWSASCLIDLCYDAAKIKL